ncbi:PREDICTED: prolyl endopeptidase FAP-like [Dufourea novaeangliae]|uniref:prolyl endopeptidase FAP-like n=1 Tax=Dufourea novaeangliae TaxID=178035 RepID=UPI00076777A3|nr:PREDICTED: prolyl endopeptidase FAP-like [Dufourea novaeangliae]
MATEPCHKPGSSRGICLQQPSTTASLYPRPPNGVATLCWTGSNRGFDLMTKNKLRNWRHLFAGGLIVAVVLGLVVTATILLTGSPDSSDSGTPAAAGISLEEWLAGSLSPKSFNGTWISGNEILYRDETGNLVIYNVTSRQPRKVLSSSNAALISSFDHQLSADRKYLLLATDYQKLYRHTYLANYRIVNLKTL